MKVQRAFLVAGLLLAVVMLLVTWRRSQAKPIPRSAIAALPVSVPGPEAVGAGTAGPTVPAMHTELTAEAPGGERHWYPRDPDEWQGMLIDLDAVPPCESSATCGLARACKEGKCLACQVDGDCDSGEVCVLDHCLLRQLAGCRRRRDCEKGSMCLLSGYSGGARGNAEMQSRCVDPKSGVGVRPRPSAAPVADDRPSLPDDDLLRRARQATPN
jgi:hypothetical protein